MELSEGRASLGTLLRARSNPPEHHSTITIRIIDEASDHVPIMPRGMRLPVSEGYLLQTGWPVGAVKVTVNYTKR